MKKIAIYFILFQLAAIFSSCEKEMMKYEGKEGVYFSVRHGNLSLSAEKWPYQPYSNVDFVSIGKDMIDFPVKVAITGPVKDYNRTFSVEVNPDSTTAVIGQHYEAFKREWTIPAGATSATVLVRVKRTPDLETDVRTLGLRLIATKDFALSFPEWDAIPALDAGTIVKKFDANLHTLSINDMMVKPVVWTGSMDASKKETGLFGVFTRKKMEFLIDNLGLTYADFASLELMPQPRQNLITSDAAAILKKRFDEGNPVLEADNRLMFIGAVPWTSIVGVPYIP